MACSDLITSTGLVVWIGIVVGTGLVTYVGTVSTYDSVRGIDPITKSPIPANKTIIPRIKIFFSIINI
jgi:hypothetical protein